LNISINFVCYQQTKALNVAHNYIKIRHMNDLKSPGTVLGALAIIMNVGTTVFLNGRINALADALDELTGKIEKDLNEKIDKQKKDADSKNTLFQEDQQKKQNQELHKIRLQMEELKHSMKTELSDIGFTLYDNLVLLDEQVKKSDSQFSVILPEAYAPPPPQPVRRGGLRQVVQQKQAPQPPRKVRVVSPPQEDGADFEDDEEQTKRDLEEIRRKRQQSQPRQ
jgi:hypothetical protein